MFRGREVSALTLIYPRRPLERQVLLGMKKRGFGAGKLNGFGGKLETGETMEESAARELFEECGLRALPEKMRWCGSLTYLYDTKPKVLQVNVYDLDCWEGEPQETEEMRPSWFSHEAVPLAGMWADDAYWLLQYLNGELAIPFVGRFRFKGHEGPDSWVVLESHVASLLPASVPRALALHGAGGSAAPGSALVATTVSFRHCPSAQPLDSFIRYHLLRGFACILVFVDDPQDAGTMDVVRRFPAQRVMALQRTEDLLERQRQRCSSFAELAPMLATEVSARQMLDAELAMALAPDLGCRWVVCLDADELFFTREVSVVPHFEALALEGVHQMTYLNHEGVPEVPDTEDYFASTTLFKQHHFAVALTAQARSCLRFWMDRSKRGQYLLFYDNGKSACQANLGAKPRSQHLWQLPPNCRSCTALADPWNLNVDGYRPCQDPCILHFPVCGFSWLSAKYRTLGDFPDKWLGKVQLPVSFHSDARAACAAGEASLEALFLAEVLLDDQAEVSRQLDSCACIRLQDHVRLLEALPVDCPPAPETAARQAVERPVRHMLPMDSGPQGIERGWILSKAVGYL